MTARQWHEMRVAQWAEAEAAWRAEDARRRATALRVALAAVIAVSALCAGLAWWLS